MIVARRVRGCLVAAMICLLYLGSGGCRQREAARELTVSAATSLKGALTEAARLYMQRHPEVRVSLNFGSSGSLKRQIEQGAPVDMFISADVQEIDVLEERGLLNPDTRRALFLNRIVLVTAARRGSSLGDWDDLAGAAVRRVAIGLPETVPCGRYAQEALERLGLWEVVQPKLVFCKDVLQIASYVRTGNADAGIAFLTDSQAAGLRVVAEAPGGSHRPVVYAAAVVKSSRQAEAARGLLEFLASPEAGAIFREHGFALPGNGGLRP